MLNILLITLSMLVPGDSLRTEMINGKLHVIHQVGEKETLYALSRRYGTTVADILASNPTADAGLEVGQILKVPYGGKPKAPDAVKTSDGIVHRVSAKETMFSIARHYNVSVDDIKLWNNLKDGNLSIGQEILIRQGAFDPASNRGQVPPTVVPAATVPTATPTAAKTHTVAPKETLYSIARMYGMTVDQIKEWNSLTSNDVKIGVVLTVAAPAPGTTVAPVTSTPGTTTAPITSPGTTPPTTPAASPVLVPVLTPTTTPTTTPSTTPSTTTSPTYVEPVRISESVAGANEVRETGTAALLQGSEGNRKYLAQHATIRPGTILKIRNLATNQEVFVRVMGPPSTVDAAVVIFISKSAYDRLGSKELTFQAEITYYK